MKANTWSKVLESKSGPLGGSSGGSMTYDSTSKSCFYLSSRNGLWTYKVADKAWTQIKPDGDQPITDDRKNRYMLCYNPEHNVIMADNGSGRVWVYRAAKRKKKPDE